MWFLATALAGQGSSPLEPEDYLPPSGESARHLLVDTLEFFDATGTPKPERARTLTWEETYVRQGETWSYRRVSTDGYKRMSGRIGPRGLVAVEVENRGQEPRAIDNVELPRPLAFGKSWPLGASSCEIEPGSGCENQVDVVCTASREAQVTRVIRTPWCPGMGPVGFELSDTLPDGTVVFRVKRETRIQRGEEVVWPPDFDALSDVDKVVGRYGLSAFEMAGALELGADGTYQLDLSYGSVDSGDAARWRVDGEQVILEPPPPPPGPILKLVRIDRWSEGAEIARRTDAATESYQQMWTRCPPGVGGWVFGETAYPFPAPDADASPAERRAFERSRRSFEELERVVGALPRPSADGHEDWHAAVKAAAVRHQKDFQAWNRARTEAKREGYRREPTLALPASCIAPRGWAEAGPPESWEPGLALQLVRPDGTPMLSGHQVHVDGERVQVGKMGFAWLDRAPGWSGRVGKSRRDPHPVTLEAPPDPAGVVWVVQLDPEQLPSRMTEPIVLRRAGLDLVNSTGKMRFRRAP